MTFIFKVVNYATLYRCTYNHIMLARTELYGYIRVLWPMVHSYYCQNLVLYTFRYIKIYVGIVSVFCVPIALHLQSSTVSPRLNVTFFVFVIRNS